MKATFNSADNNGWKLNKSAYNWNKTLDFEDNVEYFRS